MLRQEKYKKQDARQKRRDVITSFRGKIHACLNTVSDKNSYDYITHWIITNTGVFGGLENVYCLFEKSSEVAQLLVDLVQRAL